jgi:gluconolactonase
MTEPGLRGLIVEDALLTWLTSGSTWAEGPVWLPELGVVRWSDIPGDRILQYDPESRDMTVHRTGVEFTNGRTLDRRGAVIQCSHGRRAVEREVDGEVTTLVDRWSGGRFNSPNDVVVARDGSIWFTDPSYGITNPAEGHPGEQEYGGNFVFRFDPLSGAIDAVITDMIDPNGLAFSPDERTLYVSDSSSVDHHILAYEVDGTGCGKGRIFAVVEPGVPDGIRVDEHGNVWTSSAESVQVYSPAGIRLGAILVPEVVSNLCFGGTNGTTLFITASTSLYSVETLVRDTAAIESHP